MGEWKDDEERERKRERTGWTSEDAYNWLCCFTGRKTYTHIHLHTLDSPVTGCTKRYLKHTHTYSLSTNGKFEKGTTRQIWAKVNYCCFTNEWERESLSVQANANKGTVRAWLSLPVPVYLFHLCICVFLILTCVNVAVQFIKSNAWYNGKCQKKHGKKRGNLLQGTLLLVMSDECFNFEEEKSSLSQEEKNCSLFNLTFLLVNEITNCSKCSMDQ